MFKKNASDKVLGTGITLTDNKIKDIMKVIKSLENRGILLKKNLLVKKEDFKTFLDHYMTVGLPLLKRVLTPLAKSVLLLLGFSAGIRAADAANKKKTYGSVTTALTISNE